MTNQRGGQRPTALVRWPLHGDRTAYVKLMQAYRADSDHVKAE